MSNVEVRKQTLPEKPEELARLVIVNCARSQAARAALLAAERAKLPADQMAKIREAVRETQELQLDAEVALGEYFAGLKKVGGPGRGKTRDTSVPSFGKEARAAELGFDKKSMQRMETLADHKDIVEQVKAEARENDDIPTRTAVFSVVKAIAESDKEKRDKSLKQPAIPADVFEVLYADPPWEYANSGFAMSAENKYPTMPLEKIKALNFKTTDNAVLFLWTTNPQLEAAFEVIKAWGFEYKSNIAWVKKSHTAGFYVFGQHELLLICIKGSMLPVEKIKSVIEAAHSKHSEKPDCFYEAIEKMYPGKKYLEIFARRKRQGWKSWGNEVDA